MLEQQPGQMTQQVGPSVEGGCTAPFDRNGPVVTIELASDRQFTMIFSELHTIGRGHFAKVKQVMHQEIGACFAAKVLKKNLGDNTIEDNNVEDLRREFDLLRNLRHINIIHLFAAYDL